MTQQHNNTHSSQKSLGAPASALPGDTAQSLKAVIKITQALIDLSDREQSALAKNDMLNFAIMQDEKSVLAERYVQMSREFRDRLETFRGADPGLLDQLENMQKELGEKARVNNGIIDQIQRRSRQKTGSTLFNAQELAQSRPVAFEKNGTVLANNFSEDTGTTE